MQYLFTLLLLFFSFLSFGQTPCLDAVANSTGLIGEFIPQCEDDGSYSLMQCWSSTGYCWCVDENGIEISGTSLGPGQGTPDCGGGVDCIDDPGDMLTQYGFSCPELATLGCDADLSAFIDGIGFGISVYEICPESCGDCGDDIVGCTDPEACNYDDSIIPGGFDDGSCEYPGDECEGFDQQLQEVVYGYLEENCECALPLSIDVFLKNKEIIKTVNVLGQKSHINSKEQISIYIYDDGSIEKKYILK